MPALAGQDPNLHSFVPILSALCVRLRFKHHKPAAVRRPCAAKELSAQDIERDVKIMDQGRMVDDGSVSDIYTTDGGNKDEFRMDQEDTLKQMKHLLDSTLLVRNDEGDHDDNMSDINDDGNESILSDNALFRAEVEVRVHSFVEHSEHSSE